MRRQSLKLFDTEIFDDGYVPTMSLLNTIKVPKNLLYLTDRLPKPMYEQLQKNKKTSNSTRRRDDSGEKPVSKRHNTPLKSDSVSESQQLDRPPS